MPSERKIQDRDVFMVGKTVKKWQHDKGKKHIIKFKVSPSIVFENLVKSHFQIDSHLRVIAAGSNEALRITRRATSFQAM